MMQQSHTIDHTTMPYTSMMMGQGITIDQLEECQGQETNKSMKIQGT